MSLIGRDDELRRLRSWWETARGMPQPSLGVLAGESGVGKSRLVAEFATRARERGAVVLEGAATDHGFLPYEQWMTALRAQLDAARRGSGSTVLLGIEDEVAAVPWLSDLVGPRGAAHLGVPDERAVARAVGGVLNRLAQAAPTLVVLEDVQWSDQGSVGLLRTLLDEEVRGLAFLAVERRPSARRGPWHEIGIERLPRPVWQLRLTRLGRDACDELARSVIGAAADRELLDAIYRATDGNPFVAFSVAEVAHRSPLAEREIAARLPGTASSIWAERFAPLSATARQVLAVASVAGTTVEIERLVDAVGDRGQVVSALAEARDEGLVDLAPDATARFTHALLREHLYSDLTETRRRRIHRTLARALTEQAGVEPSPHSAVIAHHWNESGPTGAVAAVQHGVAAARWQMRQGSREAAQASGQEAELRLQRLGASGRVPARDLADRRRELGDLYLRLGHPSAAALMIAAAEYYESVEDIDGLARVAEARLRADPAISVRTEGTELGERLVDRADGLDDRLHSRMLARLARALEGRVGGTELQNRISVEALRLARRTGDPDTLAIALFCHYTPRPWTDERVEQIRELVELGRRTDSLEYLLHGQAFHHTLLVASGDIEAARHVLLELLEIRSRIPEGYVGVLRNADLGLEARAVVATRLAVDAQIDGRFDDQERAIAELSELIDQPAMETHRLIPTVAVQSGLLRWDRGDLEPFVPFTLDYAAGDPGSGHRQICAAFVLAETGDLDGARRFYEPLIETRLARVTRDQATSFMLLLLCWVVRDLDDEEGALVVEAALAPFSGQASCFIGGTAGPVDLGLALCASVRGDHDRAVALLEGAVEWCEVNGVRPFEARSRLVLAEELIVAGARDAALSHLARASALATELGMAGVVRAVAEAERLTARP